MLEFFLEKVENIVGTGKMLVFRISYFSYNDLKAFFLCVSKLGVVW